MRVKVAGSAGFCWGVKKALRRLDGVEKDGKRTVTFGALIYNAPALLHLEERKIGSIGHVDEAGKGDRVAVRPHGIPAEDRVALEAKGVEVLDLTCPHLLSTRKAIEEIAAGGRNILLAGNREHDEVVFLLENLPVKTWIIGSAEEALTVAAEAPLCLVSQSTFGPALFEDVAEKVKERFPEAEIRPTLCGATEDRQEETRRLAAESDVLVVVGPFHSGNARRLAEICRETGKQTFHVESPEDLPVDSLVEQARLARRQTLMEIHADDPEALRQATADPSRVDEGVVVGVTGGASTPPWILDSVVAHVSGPTGAEVIRVPPRDAGGPVPGGASDRSSAGKTA